MWADHWISAGKYKSLEEAIAEFIPEIEFEHMGYITEVQTVQCTVHCTLQGPGVPELRGPQQHAQLGGVQAALHRRDGGQREKD